MNSSKSFYYVWFLIILTVCFLGLILVTQNIQEPAPETLKVEQPAPTISPKQARINQIKNSMSLDQQIGQLILARVPSADPIEEIKKYNLGGYLIFAKDVVGENSETFPQKIASWQAASTTPMIIASDEEGGEVSRLSAIIPEKFDSPGDIYNAGGLSLLQAKEFQKANLLKGLGINVNLAPVADVAINPASFIYDRTLKLPIETNLLDAANLTAEYVKTVVTEYNKVPLGSCLKHFPGYGENADSHATIVSDPRTLDVLETIDFIPFKAGIDAGAGSILISHNICTAVDPNEPASLSGPVHALLRDNLGFKGVIISDDLDMNGLMNYVDTISAAVRTVQAGTDLIICSNYNEIIPRLKDEIVSGNISQERFNEAVDHVLSWKYDLGLI